jgi:hypothetical protein
MKDKYVIINFATMDYFKDSSGDIKYFNDEVEAVLICGMYELHDAWVVKLIYQHKENEI